MDALTLQHTQTSNFSKDDILDSDSDSYTSLEQQGKDLVEEFQAAHRERERIFPNIDPVTAHGRNKRTNYESDFDDSLSSHTDPVQEERGNEDQVTEEDSNAHVRNVRNSNLEIPSLGQQDTFGETSSIERCTDDMSIDTVNRYQIRFVAAGTTPEPFEYIPWKIQTDEGNSIHATLNEEITAVMDGKVTTKEVFSPFHNRSYQEFQSYLGENNFFFDSLDRIARLPKEKVLNNEKILQFMAFFVHDFVMDYRQICVKHTLLHQGDIEKYSVSTVRRWFSGEDNGQLEGMVQCLDHDIKCNIQDDHTDLCLKEASQYLFNYNAVRKKMYDLCTASEIAQIPIVTFGVGSVALSLVGEGKEDLLSIFYFACHHYSVFRDEFIQLLKKRHFLIPQLLSERYGKLTVVQLLVYNGDHVHPKATRASKFEEGVYVSHWFCPFVLHPMLEKKEYARVEYQQEIGKVWKERHIRMSAHSSMVIYWHYCYFHYKDLHPYLDIDGFEINEYSQSEESDTEDGCSHTSKRSFCSNYGYNRVYLTCYGDANGNELTYFGEEKLYIMEYDSHCLSILDEDGNVEDLREYRAKDLHFEDAKNIYKK